jgi:CTP synthase (UTP-ammonia lyase)
MKRKSIAVVGEFNPDNASHRATNETIKDCSVALGAPIAFDWIGTQDLAEPEGGRLLTGLSGLWISPGSPYRNLGGALFAIRTARERKIPLLGTCGGFQHIILEYARNVLGYAHAEHEETAPNAEELFISRLACSLKGRSMTISIESDSLLARCYGRTKVHEQYYCNFGVNPEYVATLRSHALRIVASDEEGEVRAIELPGHPFFIGTLFLPQMNSTASAPHPLAIGFLRAVITV